MQPPLATTHATISEEGQPVPGFAQGVAKTTCDEGGGSASRLNQLEGPAVVVGGRLGVLNVRER